MVAGAVVAAVPSLPPELRTIAYATTAISAITAMIAATRIAVRLPPPDELVSCPVGGWPP